MSVESMAIALHHSAARGSAKLILVGIANHDGDGGAWPSMATLATYAGVTERNAREAVRELERLAEIEVKLNGGGADKPEHMRPNLYEFKLQCPPNCDRTRHHRMLCLVCDKQLPAARRRLLHHLACPIPHPRSPASGGDASDPTPRSPASDEPFPEHPSTLNPVRHVPERARERCPMRRAKPGPHIYAESNYCETCGAHKSDELGATA